MKKPITINELLKLCKEQVKEGRGDNVIMISDDDEGNGYHYLWYQFMTIEEYEKPEEMFGKIIKCDFDWQDDRIAPKEKTIILG